MANQRFNTNWRFMTNWRRFWPGQSNISLASCVLIGIAYAMSGSQAVLTIAVLSLQELALQLAPWHFTLLCFIPHVSLKFLQLLAPTFIEEVFDPFEPKKLARPTINLVTRRKFRKYEKLIKHEWPHAS